MPQSDFDLGDNTLPIPHWLRGCFEAPASDVICPNDPRYEDARKVYNRIHNPYPIALVRTLNPDLIHEVAGYSDSCGIPLAIRGGGHHIGGGSGGDKGVVLDLSAFRGVHYCARTGICRVQPGARLSDIDRELVRYGRVIPTGTVSDTGVAGLTLGGGIGWLCGPLGLTCDHLIGADVLLRDGRVVKAEDQDSFGLLWALRGGGGVGIVLEFRYQTVPLPIIMAGSIVFEKDLERVLARLLKHLALSCPRELTVAPVLHCGPDDRSRLTVEYCATGAEHRGLAALLNLLKNGVHTVFRGSFMEWQSHLDADFLPPDRGYWKACYMRDVGTAEAFKLLEVMAEAPSSRCSILIEHLHGAFTEVEEGFSAFPLREARFGVLFAARWSDAAEDDVHSSWAREGYSRLDPSNGRPTYANYASASDPRAASAFSPKAHKQLNELRTQHDFSGLAGRPGGYVQSRLKGVSP